MKDKTTMQVDISELAKFSYSYSHMGSMCPPLTDYLIVI